MPATLIRGTALEVLPTLGSGTFDALITDAPYGMSRDIDLASVLTAWIAGADDPQNTSQNGPQNTGGLMGHEWDSIVPGPATWRAVLDTLKPGAFGAVFAAPRTAHLMTVALSLAGFEIVDTIVWLYGSGWPKSRSIATQLEARGNDPEMVAAWDGWGSDIKPAHEPIIVVRRPTKLTYAANVETHGTGAINVDGCRIGDTARFPANVVLAHLPDCDENDETGTFTCEPGCAVADLDTHSGILKARGNINPTRSGGGHGTVIAPVNSVIADHGPGDFGGASKFFYCAKPSKTEKNRGLAGTDLANIHPSVKPVALMAWLTRMFTPTGGTVLDPFVGSGTTGVAAINEGFSFCGIDRDDEGVYLPIAQARIDQAEQAHEI